MSQQVSPEHHESSFQGAALPHFVKSVSSLLLMLRISVRPGLRDLEDKDVARFKEELEIAEREAEQAATAAEGLGDVIDGHCEKLTMEYGQVSGERKRLATSLQESQSKLRSLEMDRELIQGRLQTAKTSLRQAEDTLRSARAKAGEKQTGRDVGIGLSFLLPCVGIPMAVAFEKERQLRKSEVDIASDDRSSLKSSISQDEEQLKQINSQVPELYSDINGVTERLEESKAAELTLKESRVQLAKLQARMRTCCQYLSTFQGKVNALKTQSQHMYNMRPLLPFLEEAAVQAQQVPDNEQLFNHIQVHKVVGDLKTLIPKVKDLLLSQDSADDYMK
ncbi:uncharacterized protein LOC132819297 [Hemiscyllium ocellatum]|uniref:uncharacterized protein LOC132819297 n=1 Tax=Hemiscyllium ocellatum TaxID=170820 RepID=UPI002966B229|nr:uncharacterized protein LOC132819297 [Hemiscyllium ocellatum]XP_060686722.1 uncharacterized protein LOC132819297 [Hemiscyllium ocellatum]